MEEILHHLGCINPVNNGINYLSAGAGFLPSTVGCFLYQHIKLASRISANQHSKGMMSINICDISGVLANRTKLLVL